MPPKVNHPVLILTQSGDVNHSHIQTTGPLTLQTILKFYKKKKGIEIVGKYKFKGLFLTLFGAAEGDETAQNQHQLPPPYDTETFYGDILLVAAKTPDEKSYEKPVDFKPEEYEEFYTKVFDGHGDSDDENAIVDGVDADAEAEPDVTEELDVDEEAEEGKEFEEEAEEEEDEEEGEAEAEDEEAAVVPAKAKAKKKKVAKTGPAAALAGTGSAYPDPPILSETEQLQEEAEGANAGSPSAAKRQEILTALKKLFGDILSTEAIQTMERCIYNGAIRQARTRHVVRSWTYPIFAHLYKMHALHITSNFHPHSYVQNTELYDSFQKGETTFESIAMMNTYELFPSHWREMFEQRQIREKKQLEGNRDRATDQFTCTRCWKRECTYYEMQTRSADEPMTIFITCLNCGKKWRQ